MLLDTLYMNRQMETNMARKGGVLLATVVAYEMWLVEGLLGDRKRDA